MTGWYEQWPGRHVEGSAPWSSSMYYFGTHLERMRRRKKNVTSSPVRDLNRVRSKYKSEALQFLPSCSNDSVLCFMDIRRVFNVRGLLCRVFWIIFCSVKRNGVILVQIVSSTLHAREAYAADALEYRDVTSRPLRSGSLRKWGANSVCEGTYSRLYVPQ
jgi:hypothetical protein